MFDKEFDNYENKGYLLDGKYQYISPIQEGSFGKVTLAYNTHTRCEVAMKAMYKLIPETRKMAKHEISILSKLGKGNDNICQLLDNFETEGYVVLVLEYCSNGDLYDLIHSGLNISAIDLWHMAKELSNGIKYANSLGIYHRDIKPENVLFNSSGRVKLCDWGLSTKKRLSNQFNVGTERYLAPECKNDEDEVYDCLYSDYWSLGITLLTAVFGTSPFKSVDNKSLESDSNFKNFVNFGKSEVLYDIYPTMNENCFNIFMNLLKTSGKDDEENKQRKIQSRSLDNFLISLENNWKFGLTIDEEYELDNLCDEIDDFSLTSNAKTSDLFDMDHDDLGLDSLNPTSFEDEDEEEDEEDDEDGGDEEDEVEELENYIGVPVNSINIPQTQGSTFKKPSSIPSLVASSGKSWCDFDDFDDDEEDDDNESDKFSVNALGILLEDLTVNSDSKNDMKKMGVEIHEREINNWHSYRV